MQGVDFFEIFGTVDDKFDLAVVQIEELPDDIGANASPFMPLKVTVVRMRIGVPQFWAHRNQVSRHRGKDGCIGFDGDMMALPVERLAQLHQRLGLDKRLAARDNYMFATIFRDCRCRFGYGYVPVLRMPRCIGGIAPDAPQITVARPEKNRRRSDEFALALNCVEELAELHV